MELIGELQRRLDAHADPARREWWVRYMKGTASFRGVTMGEVRQEVRAVWASDIAAWPVDEAKALALALLHERETEDKLAGVLLLAEHLLGELSADDLRMLSGPLADGSIDDWGATDWYAVKVLGRLASRDGAVVAEPLSAWSADGPLWLRRAPAAAFASFAGKPAPFPELTRLSLEVCAALARDEQRFAQTAVGWLLRELSKQEPDAVRSFVEEHAEALSTEARRMAMAKLEGRGRRDRRPRALVDRYSSSSPASRR